MENKLETKNIFNNMEYVGFDRAMKEIGEMKLKAVEMVTESHTQITSKICEYFWYDLSYHDKFSIQCHCKTFFSGDYPGLIHSHDIWHAAKNLTKKLTEVAMRLFNYISYYIE